MSEKFLSTYKVFQKIKWVGMFFSGSVIFFMMVYTFLDVLVRNLFGTSPFYTYEVTQNYFMPLAFFPAIAFAFADGIMPRIEFIIDKFKESLQRIAAVILLVIELVLLLLLTYFSFQYALDSVTSNLAFTAGGKNFPLAPVIFTVPLGFILVGIEVVFLLIKNLKEGKPSFKVL